MLAVEEWRPCLSLPNYEVSNLGQVRHKQRKVPRKPSVTPKGYHVIVAVAGNKHVGRYVHRLVLEAFVGPCPDGQETSHLDGDRSNNALSNLIYEGHTENMARRNAHGTSNHGERNGRRKLSQSQALELRRRFLAGESSADLSVEFGVHRSHVSRVARGKNWSMC